MPTIGSAKDNTSRGRHIPITVRPEYREPPMAGDHADAARSRQLPTAQMRL